MAFDDNHVPNGWQPTTLGKIASIVMGASPPSAVVNDRRDGLPFLQGNAEFGSQTPTPILWCSDPGKRAQPGDILVSVRAPVGETNRADREYCIGRGLAAVRLEPDDRDFGWYALRHGMPQLQRVAQGSTFDAINRNELLKFALLLPTSRERQKIASILASIDTAIERTRAVIEQVRVAKQALLADLMTNGLPGRHKKFKTVKRVGRIPAEWNAFALGSVSEVLQGIALGPHRVANRHPTPYLRVGNVQAGSIDLSEVKRIEVEPRERDRYALQEDDVLIVEGHANIGELGRAALVPHSAIGLVYQNHLFRVRPDRARLNPAFLVNWINGPMGRAYFCIFGGTTSGLNTVGAGSVRKLRVPLPPIDEQDRIASLLAAIEKRIEEEVQMLVQAGVVKSSLSDALLTGRVRVVKESKK